jgi:hypothetical protein
VCEILFEIKQDDPFRSLQIPSTQLFSNFVLYREMFFSLRHVSAQLNHLQAIYIGLKKKKETLRSVIHKKSPIMLNWDEVTGEWRKLHNDELRDLYSSPSIITIVKSKRMKWAGHVARMGEKRYAYTLLVGKPEGRKPIGRQRRTWVDNRMELVEVGLLDVDWIGLAQDRDRWRARVNSALNLRVP